MEKGACYVKSSGEAFRFANSISQTDKLAQCLTEIGVVE
jgi:hypothetical protein